MAARDKIALNVGGTWYYRDAGESEGRCSPSLASESVARPGTTCT